MVENIVSKKNISVYITVLKQHPPRFPFCNCTEDRAFIVLPVRLSIMLYNYKGASSNMQNHKIYSAKSTKHDHLVQSGGGTAVFTAIKLLLLQLFPPLKSSMKL